MPPTRFRVIERGRRLVVIDTRAAGPVAGAGPQRTRFDGGGEVVTAALYDDKAPRTLRLDAARLRIVGWCRAGAFLTQWSPEMHRPLRGWVTRYLDRVERL